MADIRHYWELDPAGQEAIRKAVLQANEPAPPAPTEDRPVTGLEAVYKVLYARDLLVGLGYENVEGRSDEDCIEAAEIEGFYWSGNGWKPE